LTLSHQEARLSGAKALGQERNGQTETPGIAVEEGSEMRMQRDHGSTHVERTRQAPSPLWVGCGLEKVLEVRLPEAALAPATNAARL
jgi:hypothetical protein